MGAWILEGGTGSHYVLDPYFPAIAIIGEEQDTVSFVGFYRGDYDLVELQVDPYTRAMRQVTLTGCRHYSVLDEPMAIPRARNGTVAVDMDPHNDCDALRVTCYRDGVLVRFLDELPTGYVRCGNVIFGVTDARDLASIHLASMTSEEAAHARSVLMGEGLEGDFEPMEG